MSEPFLGEIRMFSCDFAPNGWASCNGQLLPISQNQALFSLLGTAYGGDGQTTFGLPALQGRAPIHAGNGHPRGERGGSQTTALSAAELPIHVHTLGATPNPASTTEPTGNVLAQSVDPLYGPPDAKLRAMADESVTTVGQSQPHDNVQPFLTVSFCIALEGIFPSRQGG